jgi:hypothetical protein
MLFYQVIGSPANAFIIIVAVVIGFVSALTFIDSKRTFKDNEDNAPRFDDKK